MKDFNLEPIGTNLVVKRATVELKSESGIIMPESVTEQKLNEGVVMAVGKGNRDSNGNYMPLHVVPGDEILWGDFQGNDIVRGNEAFCILDENDVLVILR
mgnify:FL=1|tara:strand:+ start:12181 stop:12480 length:300 start_codon:yes stop_codon:yes gene_type:complete